MTILKYKDYQGEVTYEDGVLLIRLLHIDDLITADCDLASEAQATFEELVEDYVETCREVGKEPCKPFRGSFNVRITPAAHRQAAMCAVEDGVTLNTWVARAIEDRITEQRMRRQILNPQYAQRLIMAQGRTRTVSARPTRPHPLHTPGAVRSAGLGSVLVRNH